MLAVLWHWNCTVIILSPLDIFSWCFLSPVWRGVWCLGCFYLPVCGVLGLKHPAKVSSTLRTDTDSPEVAGVPAGLLPPVSHTLAASCREGDHLELKPGRVPQCLHRDAERGAEHADILSLQEEWGERGDSEEGGIRYLHTTVTTQNRVIFIFMTVTVTII